MSIQNIEYRILYRSQCRSCSYSDLLRVGVVTIVAIAYLQWSSSYNVLLGDGVEAVVTVYHSVMMLL